MQRIDGKIKFYVKTFLIGKNPRWSSLPPIVNTVVDRFLDRITFLSNDPDNINEVIRRAITTEYSTIEDMERDFESFEEFGVVNIRPCAFKLDSRGRVVDSPSLIRKKVNVIRITYMPLLDISKDKDYEFRCLADEVKKEDFLNDIMSGKIQ